MSNKNHSRILAYRLAQEIKEEDLISVSGGSASDWTCERTAKSIKQGDRLIATIDGKCEA